ncbi:MAG: RNA pseudouridine synthase [Elusimicrobiota bacterium]|jgi:23S rRNA pseudouridine955/2504/2580 synthase/23S rRNA pseudouridine1911/1915/1917 synthase|nr:RNA pseudouridine synthase [Elusimicrobiota bacterium]
MKSKIEILFSDDDLIAALKPSGIDVLADPKHLKYERKNLKADLEKQIDAELFAIHSIDKNASGIIVFAKNKNAQEFIKKQFAKNEINLEFTLLLIGTIDESFLTDKSSMSSVIDTGLEISDDKTYVNPNGKKAKTEYKILEAFKTYTLVSARPLTHFKNQMRAHFKSIGTPLAIDPIYSTSDPIFLSSFKRRYKIAPNQKEKPLIDRLTMHLSQMNLLSLSGKQLQLQAPVPKDFEVTLKQMRKYCK